MVWTKAVAPDLKLGLLGKIGHFGLQPHRTQAAEAEAVTVGIDGNMEEKAQG